MDNKSLGDLAEQKLIVKLLELGLPVFKTVGDNGPNDMVVQTADKRKLGIQVKSTSRPKFHNKGSSYKITVGKGSSSKERYDPEEVDILAVYLHDVDIWYILPYNNITGITAHFFPNNKNSQGKHEIYKNNFNLLTKTTHIKQIA